jgi:hypothetical protein
MIDESLITCVRQRRVLQDSNLYRSLPRNSNWISLKRSREQRSYERVVRILVDIVNRLAVTVQQHLVAPNRRVSIREDSGVKRASPVSDKGGMMIDLRFSRRLPRVFVQLQIHPWARPRSRIICIIANSSSAIATQANQSPNN